MRLSRSFYFAPACLAAAMFGSAHAQSVAQTLNDCTQIAEDSARLACFDGVMQQRSPAQIATPLPADLPAVPNTPPSIPATPPLVTDTKPGDSFGLPARPENEPEQLEMDVAEIAIRANGKIKVTLTNGQVWRQLGGDSTYVRLKSKPTTYSVVIKKAAMGSYRMKISPLNKTIRVRREK